MSSIDLNSYINKIYGSYTIKKFVKFRNYKKSRCPIYECLCECGKIKNVMLWDLRRGTSNSCGCSRVKSAIERFRKSGPEKVIKTYKYYAEKRNYKFELTVEDCIKIMENKCYYCGSLPKNTVKSCNNHAKYKYNGIDRIDNKKGYIIGNCVSCCRQCNRCKSNLTYDEFINWIKDVNKNLNLANPAKHKYYS